MRRFKAPAPMTGEAHDAYLRRLMRAVEDYMNDLALEAAVTDGPRRRKFR